MGPEPLKAKSTIKDFLKLESITGIILIAAAVLAVLFANTSLKPFYNLLINTPVEVSVGNFEVAKPLLLWVNDGLMAIFFLLIGLELKREFIEGELKEAKNIALPAIGAVGGMLMPALIYTYFNFNDEFAMRGWAIASATDIAFALGVLGLLGTRVPISLKVFVTSLAIFDDIGAILIIALFYTHEISLTALIIVVLCVVVLALLNKRQSAAMGSYIVVGMIMWLATLKSGVHATLAGVVLAMFIPMYSRDDPEQSPLKKLEYDLHPVVAFFILPFFAFVNAGLDLSNFSMEQILHPVSLGIMLGLFIGNQLGISVFCYIAVKLKVTQLSGGINWKTLYGAATLCGIGFTMSLFIGSLAFEETGVRLVFDERLGIILGSLLSGVVGFLILYFSLPRKPAV